MLKQVSTGAVVWWFSAVIGKNHHIHKAVEDGCDAVDIMHDKGPDYYDCILMDIQMPVMDGYEATKYIREMYPERKIPIIALLANAFEEDRRASLAAGMDEHIPKPIDVNRLIETVKKFVNR